MDSHSKRNKLITKKKNNMPEFTAALFAKRERPHGQEYSLVAHGLLFEGSKPYWEVYVGEKLFRFIAHPDYLLEDGLWQLNNYCQIPESELKHDVSNNTPIPLEEEFGEKICMEARENIVEALIDGGFHFTLVTWPGVWMPRLEEKIAEWTPKGVNISYRK
jgi:hypothetical protein